MSTNINLSQYASELKEAYKSVLDKDNALNWILLGYAKGTNDLKVVGKGEEGLEELAEEFEDDKVLFAFTRVIDPNSNLPKYVFISWCGEGAPVQRKGLLPSHLYDVQRFLSGYHVQINARDSEDVSPEYILKKMDEGSGAKYSYHEQVKNKPPVPTPSANTRPPPSVPAYKRAVNNSAPSDKKEAPAKPAFKPAPASQSLQDRFLRQVESSEKEKDDREKQEQFEKDFLARGANKASTFSETKPVSQRFQNAREREEQELMEKMERARSNRLQNTDNHKVQVGEEETRKAEQLRQAELEAQWRENEKREQEREELAKEQERLKKEQEAEKLQREKMELEKKQREQEREQQEEAERKQQEDLEKRQKEKEAERRRQEEASARQAQEKLEKARLEQEAAQLAKQRHEQEEREREELLAIQAKEAEQLKYPTEKEIENNATINPTQAAVTAIALFDYIAADETELTLKEGEMIINIVQIDEGWWQGTNESGADGIFPANYVEVVDNPLPMPEAQPASDNVALKSTGVYAIALYDYQASEEGELNFSSADKITNIEFLSDDWWQGSNASGEQGLFPANYVELQQ